MLCAPSCSDRIQSIETILTDSGLEGQELALENPPDIMFIDYKIPDSSGIEVLKQLQSIRERTIFIFMTAYGTKQVATEALRLGAHEYLIKPLDYDEVILMVKKALEEKVKDIRLGSMERFERQQYRLGSYVSQSKSMRHIIDQITKLTDTDSGNLLLTGETGTGKDTFARLVHEYSPRKEYPFIIVNCASLSEHLLESELFGHEKGAFTDAKAQKTGQVELAKNGTIYLDEIGEIPIAFQAKLLRFLETRAFYRVGGTKIHEVNVRIIAATNRNLRHEIKKGQFREDLYYRLDVINLHLPPLRDRKEDIPLLVDRFIEQFNSELNLQVNGLSSAALKLLSDYNYPGNIRELRNVIERIFLLEKPARIEPWHLPDHIRRYYERPAEGDQLDMTDWAFIRGHSLADVERYIISWSLAEEAGNQSNAAKLLNISRDQMRYKMKKYDLI